MSSEQLIPNAVGRLDPVTDAIRRRDDREAIRLLWKRGEAITKKRNEFQRLADEANAEMRSVLDFAEAYSKDAELRKSACVACGGRTEVVIDVPAYDTGIPPEELEKLGPGL